MTNRNLTFAGAALLVVGLFLPLVSMPIVGAISLFNNGTNYLAMALMVLAALAAFLAAKDQQARTIWPAAAAAGLVLYAFLRMQLMLSQMRQSITDELAENPFAGIAQAAVGSVQMQWGWLVLAAGAGLLIYAAVKADRENGKGLFAIPSDGAGKAVAAASALLLIVFPVFELPELATKGTAAPVATSVGDIGEPTAATGPSAEEADYIKNNLRLYDLDADYHDSLLDGRVPGVNFKIKNEGNRTLNSVEVRVVFYDSQGNAIAEENYTPVTVSSYMADENKSLRPNYIFQNEANEFWTAKKVPSEWQPGKATATITDIEFAPAGD